MKKIALITNYNIPEKLNTAMTVADSLEGRADVMIHEGFKDRIFRSRKHKSYFTYKSPDELYSTAELVIVIGGDGSMLENSRRASVYGIPVLGINMGRVGYMTELEPDEIDLIDNYFEGKYSIDERAMLNVELYTSAGNRKMRALALNEAVIANGAAARIIDLELSENGEVVNTYRSDGLVIATPTGSTAYSLSAGGPIVDPKLSCFCVTPVCPHSLLARPLLFPDTARLEVKNICTREKVLHLTVDGRNTAEMFFGDTVVITKSETRAKLIRLKDNGFCTKIRLNKLI